MHLLNCWLASPASLFLAAFALVLLQRTSAHLACRLFCRPHPHNPLQKDRQCMPHLSWKMPLQPMHVRNFLDTFSGEHAVTTTILFFAE